MPPVCLCDGTPSGEIAVLARRFLKINNDGQVYVNVGVNDVFGFLRLSRGLFMPDGSLAQGDRMDLGDGASIWAANSNNFRSTGGIIRSGIGLPNPATFPLTSPFCPIPAIDTSCSGPDVRVQLGQVLGPLPPGTYARVQVLNGGTLYLAPGNFTFCDFKTGQSTLVQAEGPGQTTININKRFQLGDGSRLIPEPFLAPIPFINMIGRKLRIGEGSEATAFIAAPAGKLTMGRDSMLHGTACIDFMKTDKHTGFTCPCAAP